MKYYLYTNLEQYDEAAIEQCLKQMPPSQVERINQVHHLQGKREKVIAWQLLINALHELGIADTPQIDYNPHGKPFLKNHPEVHYNISHCRTAVALAIDTERPVGIDVESRRKISDSLIRKVCNLEEQQRVNNSEDSTLEFIRIWTRKEAYYKCIGTGIQDDLHETEKLILERGLKIETHPLPDGEGFVSICH